MSLQKIINWVMGVMVLATVLTSYNIVNASSLPCSISTELLLEAENIEQVACFSTSQTFEPVTLFAIFAHFSFVSFLTVSNAAVDVKLKSRLQILFNSLHISKYRQVILSPSSLLESGLPS